MFNTLYKSKHMYCKHWQPHEPCEGQLHLVCQIALYFVFVAPCRRTDGDRGPAPTVRPVPLSPTVRPVLYVPGVCGWCTDFNADFLS